MDPAIIQAKSDEVFDTLGRKLRVRGKNLTLRINRAGRLLPRQIRRDALYIAQAQDFAKSPRLARQIDPGKIRQAHHNCLTWLNGVDPSARTRDIAWSIAGGVGLSVLVVGGGFLAVLRMRGLI